MLEMEYTILANEDTCWQRTNARQGGLLDWAMHEIDSEEEECTMQRSLSKPIIVSVGTTKPGNKEVKVEKVRPARMRLKPEQAVAIYLAKLGPKSCKTAALLAAEFCITAKAVRDVWTRKTWGDQTKNVWAMRASKEYIPPSARAAVAVARVTRALQAPSRAKLA